MPKKLATSQKRRIAAGKVAGKRQREIARDAGCSVSSVSHAGADPLVQGLIAEASRAHRGDLLRMYKRMLRSIDQDLTARAGDARQAARGELVRLMGLADQAAGIEGAAVEGNAGAVSLQELLMVAWRATEKK